MIYYFLEEFYEENSIFPSERDIVHGTGISAASVHRILIELRDEGKIKYDGRRGARTKRMERISNKVAVPLLGYAACDPDQQEEERFIEYIHMPERLVGKGKFFALIAKGESMVDEGVNPGDHVMVRRQNTAEPGDLVPSALPL